MGGCVAEAEGAGPEDRKPKSDEARSAFTPPPGMEPEVPVEDQPTSEFAVPEGASPPPAEAGGSAFATPATYSASQS
ncbi:threonine/serine exporter family protein, partial [Streptomyces sp. WAC07061]